MVALVLAAVLSGWSAQGVVTDYIRDNYPWSEVRVQSVDEPAPLPLDAPEGIVLLSGKVPGRATFQLKFLTGDAINYVVDVDAYDWVVNARKTLKKGDVIGEGDVYKEQVNIKRIPIGAITEESECIGRTLTRSVPVNRAITERVLDNLYAIKRGQEVQMLYESGAVRITAKGIARENGNVGKSIKVENPSSKKIVVGKVVDSHTVRVER
ncbi:MAG: flagellar basal body P-ring formation chaperone FlgA [Candidatus Magnetobacterium sp. LHC-1]|uniref:Flagella basal body P-ring formation protein FlgA n=1 Tax=Candidatus Magnetobacterium casense TaxID=1455061 RepID=A0ABS6RV62_9BACT|nr:flagellar basal body P-ring formation chaperone FlgA [Candidatus Magnetobacterium casensis]MBF0606432.1 flagellar basal body P-ring formation protein FlgA [Nitrospirota bacterium]MBV6340520.1 flagellar basal body P-ring formation protein FlgA [Candidatus Magnetobacterium casensis]